MLIRSNSALRLSSLFSIAVGLLVAAFAGGRVLAQTPEQIAARAGVMNITFDFSGLPPETPLATIIAIRNQILDAERFWESRLIGFSPELPAIVHRQLHPVEISVAFSAQQGTAGFATNFVRETFRGNVRSKPYAITQSAVIEFDIAFTLAFVNTPVFYGVARHEIAHTLGFSGSNWALNRLNLGPFNNYTGKYGLNTYRVEGKQPFAMFVPVHQTGAGSAGSHWAIRSADTPVNFLFETDTTIEVMTFAVDLTKTEFVSETTWAQFADCWYRVKGINDGLTGSRPTSGSIRGVPLRGRTINAN